MRHPNLPNIRPSQISYLRRFAICHLTFLHIHHHSCLFLLTFFPEFRKTRPSQISCLRHFRNCHFVKKRAYGASQPSWNYGNSAVANIISLPFCNLPFDILTFPFPLIPAFSFPHSSRNSEKLDRRKYHVSAILQIAISLKNADVRHPNFPGITKIRPSQLSYLRHFRNCHFVKKRAHEVSQPSWNYDKTTVANFISPPFCNLPFCVLTFPFPFLPFPSHILPEIPKNSTVANIMTLPF